MNLGIFGKILDIIDKVIPDATKRIEVRKEMLSLIESDEEFRKFILQYEGEYSELPKSMKIVRSMIRPIFTLWVFVMFNVFLFFPEQGKEFANALSSMPNQMWILFMIILGFWFGQRSVQYVIESWNRK